MLEKIFRATFQASNFQVDIRPGECIISSRIASSPVTVRLFRR
jgi:hypothetical protein